MQVCESILRDGQEMANWLDMTLLISTQEYLGVQTTRWRLDEPRHDPVLTVSQANQLKGKGAP